MLWKKFYSPNWSVSLEYFSFYLIIFNYLNFVFDIRKHQQYLLYIFDIRISNNFIRDLEILYNSPAIFLIHSSYRSYRSPRPFIKIRENLRFNFEKNYSPWMVALLRSVEKKIQRFCGNGFTVNSVWKNSHVSKQITGVCMNSWIDRDKAGNTKIHGIDRDHVLFPPRNCAFLVSSARKIVRRASRNEQSARNPFIYPVFQSEKPSAPMLFSLHAIRKSF